jgi:hypothetical protein
MMMPAMLRAPATASCARPAVASSSRPSAARLSIHTARSSCDHGTGNITLQQRLQKIACVAGQGDAVLSDSSFKTTTSSSTSSTITAPQPGGTTPQPFPNDTFSQSLGKTAPTAEADAETAKEAHHFNWNKQW